MGQEYYVIRGSQSWSKPTADGMSLDDVKKKLSSINSEPVKEAGTAYSDAADALAEMSTALRGFAETLVKHWKGDEAKKAVAQLQQVHTTSINLSNSSHTNASTYTWYGTQILDWYKQAGQDASDGLIHTSGDDKHGRELMQRFLNRTGEAFNAHPTQITKDLPEDHGGLSDKPTFPGGPNGPGAGGGGGFGGGGGGLPGAGAGGGGGFGSDPGGLGKYGSGSSSPFAPVGDGGPHLPGGTGSGGSGGFGSDPGGLGGSHGGGGSLGGSGGLGSDLSSFPGGGGGGGLPGGGAGGGLGADPGGLGGGAGAGGGLGGFGATPGGLGAAGGGLGAAGAAGRAGAGRMGGMPMGHGGHGNGKEEERERTTWLSEDDDVWGADDDTAPPVIG
ncbi:hypothetical protein GCM10009527_022850 [Actinomadura nitritigenes]|uniref:WXG100 family type VII secretion target n=1 Tax=Actinomadura nitritigenes TaxID=134602 RepID=A0ABS3REN0_9ACTN|nr:hypothetical protein [Actinomadura nitritigenes]MBO2444053.1 hypothetical protein [Actinomadura nitritigenes]